MSRRIGIASVIWGVSILLSRVVGLVREAVLGRTLGAGEAADVYQAAFVIPDFLNYLLAGGALSIVFIPIFGAWLARGEEARGWESFSVIATFLGLLLGAGVVVLEVVAPWLAPLVAPGFGPEATATLVAVIRIILPAQVFHVVGGLLSAALQARDRHALPALAPLLYTGSIVAGGLIGGVDAGVFGFAWGVLVGSILGPFGLPLLGCLRHGLRWRFRLDLRHPDLHRYLLRSLPIMVGWSIIVVDDWFLRRQGSLLGEGAVATLAYAKTLMKVPMGVFGLAAGVAAFPSLARLVAEGRLGEMYRTLQATTRGTLLLAVGAQAVLTVAGTEIMTVVYGRVRIPPEQLGELGLALALVSLGLGAWAANAIVARGFYAMGNTWLPALLGTAVAASAYPVYVVARAEAGVVGLALCSAGAVTVYVLLLGILLRRSLARRGTELPPSILSFLARVLVALALAVGAGQGADRLLPAVDPMLLVLARGAVLAAVALGVYVAAARLLGLEEVGTLWRRIRRRLPGGATAA